MDGILLFLVGLVSTTIIIRLFFQRHRRGRPPWWQQSLAVIVSVTESKQMSKFLHYVCVIGWMCLNSSSSSSSSMLSPNAQLRNFTEKNNVSKTNGSV